MTATLPTFGDQPELPSPRVQTAWMIRLQQVSVARDKSTAHQHYNNGVGRCAITAWLGPLTKA